MIARVLFVLCCCAVMLHAKQVEVRDTLQEVFGCEYKGYEPGGKVTEIGKIKAPIAKMETDKMASIVGKASQLSTRAKLAMDVTLAVVKSAAQFAKLVPGLGQVIGLFSSIAGQLALAAKPGPQDILDQANKAMATLTKDVNDKLDKMKGYVDAKVIGVQKDLINREYKSNFNLFMNCVEEVTEEHAKECQREAFSGLKAMRPKFAVFEHKIASGEISNYEMRTLEAYLIAFRNYANLVLTELQALVNVYKDDKSKAGKDQYARYRRNMRTQAKSFISYADAAVDMILKTHAGKTGEGVCPGTVSCGPWSYIKEGFWASKVHTQSEKECTVTIEEGTKQLCHAKFRFRADGKYPHGYTRFNFPKSKNNEAAAEAYTEYKLFPECFKYQLKNAEIAKAYWQQELLDFVPVWKMAIENNSDDETNEDILADEIQYSPRFAARWEKAEQRSQ